MATRDELTRGIAFVSEQAVRVGDLLDEAGEWDARRESGWTPKEMLAHVAATLGLMPKVGPGVLNAPPDADIIEGIDMAAYNERGISKLREMPTADVVRLLRGNCAKMSEWVATLTDEQLATRHKFRGMPMTMSDYLMTTTVMHSLHHLFEAPLSVAL